MSSIQCFKSSNCPTYSMWLHRILTQIQVIVRRITKTYVSRAFVGQLNKEKSGEEGANALLFK